MGPGGSRGRGEPRPTGRPFGAQRVTSRSNRRTQAAQTSCARPAHTWHVARGAQHAARRTARHKPDGARHAARGRALQGGPTASACACVGCGVCACTRAHVLCARARARERVRASAIAASADRLRVLRVLEAERPEPRVAHPRPVERPAPPDRCRTRVGTAARQGSAVLRGRTGARWQARRHCVGRLARRHARCGCAAEAGGCGGLERGRAVGRDGRAGVRPVPVQTWEGRAQSRCRCGQVSRVLAQMWRQEKVQECGSS